MPLNLLDPLRRLLAARPAGPPPPAVDIATLSPAARAECLAAAQRVAAVLEAFRGEGRTAMDTVMAGQPYEPWRMYPQPGGVLDQRTASQYFYHAHPDYRGEHGHFHTFLYDQRRLVHLVAVHCDARGRIVRLSTFNRWGPGDHYLPATQLKALLPRFRVQRGDGPDPRLNALLNDVLVAFRPEIEHLFDERDATFARYREQHGGAEPFEDRSLEITSTLAVDLPAQIARLEALDDANAVPDATQSTGAPAATGTAKAELEAEADAVLHALPDDVLQRCHAAGEALLATQAELRSEGRSVLDVVLNGQALEPWAMYPWEHGVVDRRRRSQYFYHAHPQTPEHGHFHVFHTHRGELAHLVAVALDDAGAAIGLFTVNRWVTGDAVLPPRTLARYLARWRVGDGHFDARLNAWLRHLLTLYAPWIERLLHEREATYAAYREAHGGAEPYEDRDLEVTSSLDIDPARDVARLAAERARRRPNG